MNPGAVVRLSIDGKEVYGRSGQRLKDVAADNGIYIPTLCDLPGTVPRGSCRICSVKINGRINTACTTNVSDGMNVENDTEELNNYRKEILEILFVEGNHFCPACERSGDCELQALAYRFRMDAPRFPYLFPVREIEASHPVLIKDHNRCILCKRCIRGFKDDRGRSIFAYRKRGHRLEIAIDTELSREMTPEEAHRASRVCPVGAILERDQAFRTPIGNRRYDHTPTGEPVESQFSAREKGGTRDE